MLSIPLIGASQGQYTELAVADGPWYRGVAHDQRAAGVEVNFTAVAEAMNKNKGTLDADRANPFAVYSAGNNVDHAAHGI